MVEVGMEMDVVKKGRGRGAEKVSVLMGGDAEFSVVPRQGETVAISDLGLSSNVVKVSHFTHNGRPYLVLQPQYTDDVDETVADLESVGWTQV